MSGKIYVATETYTTDLDGVPVSVTKDTTRVREGHDLIKRNPQYFKELNVHFDVEQATAAPAEKRAPAPEPVKEPAPEPVEKTEAPVESASVEELAPRKGGLSLKSLGK